jgi:hypothetical protein
MRFYKGKPVVRCSGLDRLLGCNGSDHLVEALGEQVVRDDSLSWEGQWCHWNSAMTLVQDHQAMAPDGGLPPPRVPAGWQPTQFAEWMSAWFVSSVLTDTDADMALAVELELVHEFAGFWLSGHLDVTAFAADAEVINFDDLKAGSNVVDEADSNWQVLGYQVLLKLNYPQAKRIEGRIRQPRKPEELGDRTTRSVLEGERLEGAAAFLEREISKALGNIYELNSGKQCRLCPAWLRCPAHEGDLEKMKMTISKEVIEQMKAAPDEERLAKFAIARKDIGPHLEEAAKLLKPLLEKRTTPLQVDGRVLTIIPGKGPRKFKNVAAAWEKLNEVIDDPDLIYSCMDLSPEPMEKALAKQFKIPHKTKVPGRDDGASQFKYRFGELVTREETKILTIA